MKLSIRKVDIYVFFLTLIYILGQNFLYLAPVNNFYNICAYILLLLFTVCIFGNIQQLKISNSVFNVLMLTPIILSLLAAVVEIFYYSDASLLKSFYRQMQWWVYGFAYFMVLWILKKNKMGLNKITTSFVWIGIIQVCIGIVQYLLTDKKIFTYAPTTTRLGQVRYYFPVVLMVFVYFWALNMFLNHKKRIISLVLMIAVLFEVAFVQQFRATLIGVIIATVIGFMLWRNVSYKKVITFLLVVIVAYIFYLNSEFLQNSIAYIFGGDTSLNVRKYLIDFILENAKSKWLFGAGWVSSDGAYAYASTPYRVNINWGVFAFADGGIFSILYSYGIFGLFWVSTLWYTMLKKGWYLFKHRNNYLYLLFPLYMLFTMYIDIHWYIHDQFFVLALFCALLEYETKTKANA